MTLKVEMTEMKSRFGWITVIKVGRAVLITPCDARTKILKALSNGELTSEAISEETGVSYSCVMDHLDLLEKLGVVNATLKREEGKRRRIHFHLSEDPLDGIENLFITTAKSAGRSNSIIPVSSTI